MYSLRKHYDEIEGKKLKVYLVEKDRNGRDRYEGEFLAVTSDLESSTGIAELEIDTGEKGIFRAFDENEIETIEVIS